MPKLASSNPDAKLTYLNGHFGYYQKCIISTNALGVIRNVNINGRAQYVLSCENPCSPSKCGRIKNITIHHNYTFNTSMPRDSVK